MYSEHGIGSCGILTEIPTPNPKAVTIGFDTHSKTAWANMGSPRKMPEALTDATLKTPVAGAVEQMSNLSIRFRTHDMSPFTDATMLSVNGYLVFTGEPHLVILTDTGFSISELSELPFLSATNNVLSSGRREHRVNFGTWLVNKIGTFINARMSHIFPWGININFVRIIQNGSQVIEYRTFERGINRETYACGTGAVAAAYTVRQLGLIDDNPTPVWPFMARLHDSQARILVEEHHNKWILHGNPKPLFQGEFLFGVSKIKADDASGKRVSNAFERFPFQPLSPNVSVSPNN
jgi:diaminopimelate epimerase